MALWCISSSDAAQVFDEDLASMPGDLGLATGAPFVQSIISGQVNVWKAGAVQV
jgi:hypothetical protein